MSLTSDPSDYSLADFFIGDSANPLHPPEDYTEWRKQAEWATRLYDAQLLGPATPRALIATAGGAPATVLNFASYNYLGLSRHPKCVAAAQEALLKYGTGICGPPLLSGMTDLQQELEQQLNALLGTESTIVFSGGYSAAIGTISAILRKGDIAVADDRVHMSAVDGVKLGQARLVTYQHNDPSSLAACIEKHKGSRILVITEGIYSVDGDMPPLGELLDVTDHYGVPVYIDEAHSILGCGSRGGGVVEMFGVENRVGLRLSTFSKAFAGVGGAVSGSRETLDYIRFYGNSYTFSACLPPATLASLIAAAKVSMEDTSLRERLWDNGAYFRTKLNEIGVDTGKSTSYIVPIMVGSNRKLLYELCHAMRRRGLFIPPVDYPVVPQDEVRFRAAVTAAHTRQELDEALNIIEDTVVKAIGKRT
ncbi:MAG TPA: aminotransferase class I/II-fold pyridoxal phosphate-dependent enzyme [Terriglobia bacterium]|nr:aminotransferase class I/II-fold pyridoxal phosphate-dependent enzyme [Terriglobia bacterium]